MITTNERRRRPYRTGLPPAGIGINEKEAALSLKRADLFPVLGRRRREKVLERGGLVAASGLNGVKPSSFSSLSVCLLHTPPADVRTNNTQLNTRRLFCLPAISSGRRPRTLLFYVQPIFALFAYFGSILSRPRQKPKRFYFPELAQPSSMPFLEVRGVTHREREILVLDSAAFDRAADAMRM